MEAARDAAPLPRSALTDAVMLLAYMCIAGSAFLFTKHASSKLRPCMIAVLRLAIGGSSLLVMHLCVHGLRSTSETLRTLRTAPVALVGALNTAVPYSLYAASMSLGVKVWFAAVVSGTAPLFAILFARCVTPSHRRPSCIELAGLGLGLAGLATLALKKELVDGGKSAKGSLLGPLGMLTAVACKALAASLAQKQLAGRKQEVPLGFALAQTLWGLCFAACFVLIFELPTLLSSSDAGAAARREVVSSLGSWPGAWPALLYLGLASSCLVYVLQFTLLRRVGAVRQLTVDYGTPVVGVVEGALRGDFAGLTAPMVALLTTGSVLALAGVSLVHVGGVRARRAESSSLLAAGLVGEPSVQAGSQDR